MKIYFSSGSGDFGFLSNFYERSFEYSERMWKTSESCYQAMKSPIFEQQEWVRASVSPGESKRRGRQLAIIREDWDDQKLFFMEDILHYKFLDGYLRVLLLDTGDAELIEYTYWNDRYWGVGTDYKGENHLGKILMKVRAEIAKKYM